MKPLDDSSMEWATETDRAQALVLLERALKTEPRLTHFGIGIFDDHQNFDDERARLATALSEIAAASDWIAFHGTSYFRGHSSYWLKHAVERWFRGRGVSVYVSNGSFIAAAIGRGLSYVARNDSPNVHFKFKSKARSWR